MKFQDKQVVVIGGSSGIGLATAQAFAHEGAIVTITGRSSDKLEAACSHALPHGRQLRGEVLEGQDDQAVGAFFQTFGPIDHLVIVAGGAGVFGPFRTIDEVSFRAAFDRKFWIQVLAARYGAGLIREGGSMTFVSAATAQRPTPSSAGLAAINGAINALVGPLALELAPIRVNAIAPGIIDTPNWKFMGEEASKAFLNRHATSLPVKRVGQPEDVAEAILFVAANGYITGTILVVDGGYMLTGQD